MKKLFAVFASLILAVTGVVAVSTPANAVDWWCAQAASKPARSGNVVIVNGQQSCTGNFQRQTLNTKIQYRKVDRPFPLPDIWADLASSGLQGSSSPVLNQTARALCPPGNWYMRARTEGTGRYGQGSAVTNYEAVWVYC